MHHGQRWEKPDRADVTVTSFRHGLSHSSHLLLCMATSVVDGAHTTLWSTHPSNPRTWSNARKWRCVALVSGTAFLSTLTSSIPVPAIRDVQHEFHIGSQRLVTFSVSVFILGVGVGPLLFGTFVRRPSSKARSCSNMFGG